MNDTSETTQVNSQTQNSFFKDLFRPCRICFALIVFLIVMLAISAFAIGVLWTKLENGTGLANNGPTGPQVDPVQVAKDNLIPIQDEDYVVGDRNAEVSLIVYSDYECPFCQAFHPTSLRIVEEYDGRVNMVFRHFPLDSIHALAIPMAEAAECVADQADHQGFWEYTNAVMEEKPSTPEAVREIALRTGVNANTYDNCITEGTFTDKILEQRDEGVQAGVGGTPGDFLYNNETGDIVILGGNVPYTNLKSSVDGILSN